MRKVFLFLVLIFFLLTSCQGSPSQEKTLVDAKGGVVAVLKVVPNPPPVMQEVSLELLLKDQQGESLKQGEVTFDLVMPSMEMPPNQPQATFLGEGLFRAQAMFTMAGDWEIQALVNYQGTTIDLSFPLKIP